MSHDEVQVYRSRVHSLIESYNERTKRVICDNIKSDEKVSGGAACAYNSGEQPDIDDDSEQHGNGLYMGIKKLVRVFGVDV